MKNPESFSSSAETEPGRELERADAARLGSMILGTVRTEEVSDSDPEEPITEGRVASKEKIDIDVPKPTREQEQRMRLNRMAVSWQDYVNEYLDGEPSWQEMQAIADECRVISERSEEDYHSYLRKVADTLSDEYGVYETDTYSEVWRYNTLKKYGVFPQETSFYFSTNFDVAKDFLQGMYTGTYDVRGISFLNGITEKDSGSGGGNQQEEILGLSFDTFDEDGKVISGLDKDRGASSDEVVFVLDSELQERSAIDTLVKYPTINRLDLYANGLAVVCKNEDIAERMREYLAGTSIDDVHLPVYTHDEWLMMGEKANETAKGANKKIQDEIQRAKLERAEREAEQEVLHEEELKRQIFTEVDEAEVRETVGGYAEKIDSQRMDEICELCDRDLEAGERAALEYFSEVFELAKVPELRYYDDENDNCIAYYRHGSVPVVAVNTARYRRGKVKPANLDAWLGTMAHEIWHGHQHTVADVGDNERSELYGYNFKNYISDKKDFEGYRAQLVERESQEMDRRLCEMLAERTDKRKQELHQEVIGEVSQEEAAQEVATALDGMKMSDLLRNVGVASIDELYTGLKENPTVAVPAFVNGLSRTIGMPENPEVKFDKDSNQITNMNWRRGHNSITINPEKFAELTPEDMVLHLAFRNWYVRDHQKSEDNNNERGEAYNYFFRNYEKIIGESSSDSQNIVQMEANLFAWAVQGILKEQHAEAKKSGIRKKLSRLFGAKRTSSYSVKYGIEPLPDDFEKKTQNGEYTEEALGRSEADEEK